MAPIPSTFAQEIIDLLENLDRRRKDLLDFQIPRLRDCTGSLVTQQQYAAEVREDIEAFSRIVEVRAYSQFSRLNTNLSSRWTFR